LKFSIVDTGIGISEIHQDMIFSPFEQVDNSTSRKYAGTGLGLAICKKLVTYMNGEIGVESQENVGSKFWFTMELEKAEPEIKSAQILREPVNMQSRNNKKILLVEDNMINQKITLKMLEKLGYHVDAATDGTLALLLLREKTYDLILMDCQMPHMDGYQTTQIIRHQLEITTPIIALTAHALQGDREKCVSVGMNDYLSKPVDMDELQKTVENWLFFSSTTDNIRESIMALRSSISERLEFLETHGWSF
jgi:two-component system CheB/CheR fusion protein